MDLSPAPFFEDVAGGPAGGAAHWLTTSDGTRIRVGHWRPEGEATGTGADKKSEDALNLSRNDRPEIQRRLLLIGHDPNGIDGGL